MEPTSQRLFMGASGSGEAYWIATLAGAVWDEGSGIAVDNNGNVYVVGQTNSEGAGNDDLLIVKYDASGTIQWQRSLGGSSGEEGYGIAVDGNGDVYVVGETFSQGAGSNDLLIAKYDSSGTIQWQRSLGGSGNESGEGIAIDSNGDVYVAGVTNSQGAGSTDALIAKYDSSGTIQWQRSLGGSSSDRASSIAVDSSNNVYVVGQTASQGAGSNDVLIAKYNSSGTIQWQRSLGGSSSDTGYGITVNSSGDVYVAATSASQGAGGSDILVAKYNTSGTIQWQRSLGGTVQDEGRGIAIDSSDNVYVIGYSSSSGTAGDRDIVIAKYNSSGAIQWQRFLGGSQSDTGLGIAVDSKGNVYVTGYIDPNNDVKFDIFIAKLPGDGSLTGTYGYFTYQASSLTDATRTLTSATRTLTAATRTLTAATRTLTDASRTLTSTTTPL